MTNFRIQHDQEVCRVEYVGNYVIWKTLYAKCITYGTECVKLNFNKILIQNIQSD